MSKKQFEAIVPSNIAFLKYWGKTDEDRQWPANDSLSMTLSDLHTKTVCEVISDSEHRVILNGSEVDRDHKAGAKIFKHLDFLKTALGSTSCLSIKTENSFPTGCGIASSASGLGALTLAAVAAWLDANHLDQLSELGFPAERLADLARMGSGSAFRSFMGGVVQWHRGEDPSKQNVSAPFNHNHWPLMDSVVLFSQAEKSVGSTEAHRAAWSSPMFAPRLAAVEDRLDAMKDAIDNRDMRTLGPLLEQETLEMHSVIMSAETPVRYFDKETGDFLAWIRQQRRDLDLPVYFTLDAGPNVHLIYENHLHERVLELLHSRIPAENILSDHMGAGPSLTIRPEEV